MPVCMPVLIALSAHPPCERWGRYWGGAPKTWPRLVKGDDKGCFASALASVRKWGGVLEHPEGSAAWPEHFSLINDLRAMEDGFRQTGSKVLQRIHVRSRAPGNYGNIEHVNMTDRPISEPMEKI